MSDLALYQYVLIGLIFIWSGFVRSGLGFGGAVLSLPFLLLVLDDPLVFLPIIAVHLLVFSSLTIWMNNRKSSGTGDDGAAVVGTVECPTMVKLNTRTVLHIWRQAARSQRGTSYGTFATIVCASGRVT